MTTATLQTKVWLVDPQTILPGHTPHYHLSDSEMSSHGWVFIQDVEVTFTPKTLEQVVPEAIALLREQQRRINLKAAEANANTEAYIANLLSLTYEEQPDASL